MTLAVRLQNAYYSLIDRLFTISLSSERQNELASLRLRLVAEPNQYEVSNRERQLAQDLRELRKQMIKLIVPVRACCTCGKGFPPPNGCWDGGYCCGGTTENVFSQVEIASLRAAGTDPDDFPAPDHRQAGCMFRSAIGCLLQPEHRPNLCVRYACRLLREEYENRGISAEVSKLASNIQRAFHEFSIQRDARVGSEAKAAMEHELKIRNATG